MTANYKAKFPNDFDKILEVNMGGIGSGRRGRCGAKNRTEDYRVIDVRLLQRDGFLIPRNAFFWQWERRGEVVASIQVWVETGRVILKYCQRNDGGEWKDECYPVYLDWTRCNLGGSRPWFLCPAPGCGRRVAILYGRAIFACRHCCQLAYSSQLELKSDRAARKANGIRKKLEWKPGIFNENGWKPKGMHWRTFDRLTSQHNALVQTALVGMVQRLTLK